MTWAPCPHRVRTRGKKKLGCELQVVHMNTLQVLADPIQSAISTNQKYYVIAK